MTIRFPFVAFCVVLFAIAVLLQHPFLVKGQVRADELFAFPADVEINPYLENARNRTPVYIPNKCSENEILYPGDHDNDWVCDCRPGHVYYPEQDRCYPLFQKGFCREGEYVDLARPSMLVKCTQNTCKGKNEVPYQNKCVKLHQNNRLCRIEKRVSWVIGVNITTLELDCVKGTPDMLEKVPLSHRTEQDRDEVDLPGVNKTTPVIFFPNVKLCHNGTKAMYNGMCP